MPVNTEIKGQLAKLLATEDLIVENRKVSTAQFNVNTRVLTLPKWDRASNNVYDLLVGHEVGHALFTPNIDPPNDLPHHFLNVTEDARIEKLMKRKYPGLSKTFYRGYKELADSDFFCIEGEDVSKMNLADRVNLYFKIGNYENIPIENDREKEILKMVAAAETFDDAISAAKVIYEYCKEFQETEKKETPEQNPEQNPNTETSGNGSSSSQDQSEQDRGKEVDGEDTQSSEEQSETSKEVETNESNTVSKSHDPLEVKTQQSLSNQIENLSTKSYGEDPKYLEIPDVNLDVAIVDNEEIYSYIDAFYSEYDNKLSEQPQDYDPFLKVDDQYRTFKKSAQKEVNYLLKEFECKKAADSYARATTARTGILDCTKLHTYKYNEDLFKKVSIIPDGKNHGLVFILDWSGSMAEVLLDTIKQLYNLIWFCKKANIPFDVYAFTNEWFRFDGPDCYAPKVVESIENQLFIDESFRLLNLFNHRTKAKDFEHQMLMIWRIANAFQTRWGVYYEVPYRMSLSGTPLNETVICLHKILPQFKNQNKVQKVQCVILTDGESGWLSYTRKTKMNNGKERFSRGAVRYDVAYLRDRKLGTTYLLESKGWGDLTDVLLHNLSDRNPDINFVGIRLLGSKDISNFISRYTKSTDESTQLRSDWKKNRSVAIKSSSYDVYFGLSAQSLAADTTFEVSESATKSQIKSAFVKSLSTKKLNKKVLSEFVNLIA